MIGTLIHTVCGMHARLIPGIDFAAKFVLEVAVVLLGVSISFAAIRDAGLGLLGVVAGVVICSLGVSYGLGRMVGLSDRLATLVACGNSICGNSAIVAAAPVIDADSDDIAASIAFTAALGILVVLLLPLLPSLSGMNERHYGIFAGMTVYAVPQVLAATVPVGVVSTQIGALVKLMRVLMLGPVILALGMKKSPWHRSPGYRASRSVVHHRLSWDDDPQYCGFRTPIGYCAYSRNINGVDNRVDGGTRSVCQHPYGHEFRRTRPDGGGSFHHCPCNCQRGCNLRGFADIDMSLSHPPILLERFQ